VSVPLYMDVHVPGPVTRGLKMRGVIVLTAQEDGHGQSSDSTILERATELNYALVSQDDDLLAEASKRMRQGIKFSGVIYADQLGITIGCFIADLELISLAADMDYIRNRVEWLPLKR
jgi:hypothetical protein